MTWSRVAWLGLAAIILTGALLFGFHTTYQVRVTTAAVTTGDITREVFATGTLQAVTTVEVGTQVSGTVKALEADYNSVVRRGQIVARLDPATYEAQLESAKAALGQAQADVLGFETAAQDARTKLARAEALSAEQLIPQSDLDDARVTFNEASANIHAGRAVVTEAEAAVRQASVNLSYTIIRSPIDGVVIERAVDVGQTLAASIQSPVLFRIAADLSRMQVNVDVDESDVDGLNPGQVVDFEVESYPNQTFHGTLREMRLQPVSEQTATASGPAGAPVTSQAGTVGSYTTVIDVDNADEKLRPGMTAQVILNGSHRDRVVRIPNAALSFRPPPQVLRALGEDDTSQAVSRETREVWRYDGHHLTPIIVRGGLADDRWTELLEGAIHPGDALATDAVVQQRSGL